jgi:hypothetical protein
MMHYPIPEIGGKNFSFNRILGNKANTRSRPVSSIFNFLIQPENLALVILLELQSVDSLALIPPSVEIGLEEIG